MDNRSKLIEAAAQNIREEVACSEVSAECSLHGLYIVNLRDDFDLEDFLEKLVDSIQGTEGENS